MHLRKMRKKWQCIVRHKGHMITQSFVAKSDARLWGERTNTELRNGTYRNNDKLISMTLKDLLQLYLEKIAIREVFGSTKYKLYTSKFSAGCAYLIIE